MLIMFSPGEKMRIFSCCARPVATAEGCTHGPHVFYESKAEDLHSRYPFSFSRPPSTDANETALDVVALDCEMIYTTGGSRVARVSVVDGSGTEVFDEFVRMDEGVEVMYVLSHLYPQPNQCSNVLFDPAIT